MIRLRDRFRVALLAFKDPRKYWDGCSIQDLAGRLTTRREIAVIQGMSCKDGVPNWTIHHLDHDYQRALRMEVVGYADMNI